MTLIEARKILAGSTRRDESGKCLTCRTVAGSESGICRTCAERVVLAALEQADSAYRMYVWLNHGHTGQYGDDGEMQCGECMRLGFYDYKREPLEKIQAGLHQLGLERIAAAFEAARVFEREE